MEGDHMGSLVLEKMLPKWRFSSNFTLEILIYEKKEPKTSIVQGIFDYLHNQTEIAIKVFNNIFIKAEAMRDITMILPAVINTVINMTDA